MWSQFRRLKQPHFSLNLLSFLQTYCSICFSPCQTFRNVPGFLLTRSANNATGTTTGTNCPDQLIIPGGTNGGNIRESVYCGAALNPAVNTTGDAPICSNKAVYFHYRYITKRNIMSQSLFSCICSNVGSNNLHY